MDEEKPTPEDIAWATEIAKGIDRNAPRRPLKDFIAELRSKKAPGITHDQEPYTGEPKKE